jgi:hypothetical protein
MKKKGVSSEKKNALRKMWCVIWNLETEAENTTEQIAKDNYLNLAKSYRNQLASQGFLEPKHDSYNYQI